MGFFEKIFGGKKEPKREENAEVFRFLRGYTPSFSDFGGSIFESDLIRAALDAHGRHAAKLAPQFEGAANEYLKNRLMIQPNEWQTWPQWLYRHAVILYARNTVFTVPVRGSGGDVNGIIDILPEKWELVEYNGQPWLRFFFDHGKRTAVSLYEVGIQCRFQFRNELFGEENDKVLKSTLDLIEIQRQGVKEGIKNSASYRFYASHNNFTKEEDLQKERKRFVDNNLGEGSGGLALFPHNYSNVQQIQSTAKIVDPEQMELIQTRVLNYFGCNEEVLQNKTVGDAWSAYYEGKISPS
jgi:hypothetical protein